MTNNTVNRIELIGYMGAMPEMRYTPNGAPVTNFSMATNRIWKGQDGESYKQTDWHRITAWGRLAEETISNRGRRLRGQYWRNVRAGHGPIPALEG